MAGLFNAIRLKPSPASDILFIDREKNLGIVFMCTVGVTLVGHNSKPLRETESLLLKYGKSWRKLCEPVTR